MLENAVKQAALEEQNQKDLAELEHKRERLKHLESLAEKDEPGK